MKSMLVVLFLVLAVVRDALGSIPVKPHTKPRPPQRLPEEKDGVRDLSLSRTQNQPKNLVMIQDEATSGSSIRPSRNEGSPNLLASFAGKNRVLVISAPHESDGYYRLMMSLLKPDVYCELAERHVQQVMVFHQEGEIGGKVRRITTEGKIMEEPLDPVLIPRLMNFLKLEKGKFCMVLLRKTLQVEERYPYPVRLEAVYEVIDQAPARRFEKIRQKGFVQKCKAAGVEGQVVEIGAKDILNSDPKIETPEDRHAKKKPSQLGTTTTTATTTSQTTTTATTTITIPTTTRTSTIRTTTTTTLAPTTTGTTTTTTTTTAPTMSPPTTTTTRPPTKRKQNKPHLMPKKTAQQHPNPNSTTDYNKGSQTDKGDHGRDLVTMRPTPPKPSIPLILKKNNAGKVLNPRPDIRKEESPIFGFVEEAEREMTPTRNNKKKPDKKEKKKSAGKTDKVPKRDKMEKREKPPKEGKGESLSKKPTKKTNKSQDKDVPQDPLNKEPPKSSLSSFKDYFENRRRLMLITTPSEEHAMYVQQRDEYLEHVCEMAIRKLSIITIFGHVTNSTMKIDHYQLEHDVPMKGLRKEDLVDQELISELRKSFSMMEEGFFMVLTDFDMKVKQFYEMPIAMKGMFDFIDTFSSRVKEMEQQKMEGKTCNREDKPRSLENFLSRFRWRRRLFIISAPNDEEWAYQQQLQALSSQACNLGLRHMAVLKLLGVDAVDMGGVLELYPINGSATVEREGLSVSLVRDLRNYFQVTAEYFSMLLVGKDGNVKSWYPSPMWSMAIIYDLVDSMQLRRQEMAIQQSLGLRCPEEEYGGYGYHNQGYHDEYQDSHHQGYGY